MTRVIIRQPAEETTCCVCGCPLYVGDWAQESNEQIYCSEACLHEDRSHNDGLLPIFSRDECYPD